MKKTTSITLGLLLVAGLVYAVSPFDKAWEKEKSSLDFCKPPRWAECLVSWNEIRNCPNFGIYGRSSLTGEMDICFQPGTSKHKQVKKPESAKQIIVEDIDDCKIVEICRQVREYDPYTDWYDSYIVCEDVTYCNEVK